MRAIISDLFDVLLIADDPASHRKWEAKCGLAEGGLKQAMFARPHFGRALRGEITEKELWEQVAQNIGLEAIYAFELGQEYYEALTINQPLLDFFTGLRPGCKLAILSNAPSGIRSWLNQKYHLGEIFEEIIISAEEKLVKPDEQIYRLALKRLGVQARDAIFLDDQPDFVEGARRVGLNGVVFKETAQAILDIKTYLTL